MPCCLRREALPAKCWLLSRSTRRFCIQLPLRRCGLERFQGFTERDDALDVWELRQRALKALRIKYLRYQAAICHRRFVAVAKRAAQSAGREDSLDGQQSFINPVAIPLGFLRFGHAQAVRQVTQYPQVVKRMDVAGNGLGDGPNVGPGICRGRQQRDGGVGFVQPFDDGQRLGQDPRVCFQARHYTQWILGLVGGLMGIGIENGVRQPVGRLVMPG